MPKQAKRRFVGLNTEEVSLVDSPANEVDFLVIKNQEKPRMAGQAQEKATLAIDVEDDGDTNVVKALEHVNSIVSKIGGIVGTKKESKPPAEGDKKDDDDSEDNDGDTEGTETAKSLEDVFAGLDAATAKTLKASLKKAGFPFPPKPGKGKGKGKASADDDDEDDEKKTKKSAAADESDAPLTLAGLVGVVQKAAAFTPARVKALQDAQEILKIVLEAVAPGKSPNANVPVVESHGNVATTDTLTKPNKKPTITGTLKSSDEPEVVELIKSLSGAVGTLLTRVEAIEKGRPASNSVGDDGPPDTTTQKSKSIWSGVL